MRHKVHLQSLSVGRCFTLPVEPEVPSVNVDGDPVRVRHSQMILDPQEAWKVVDVREDGTVLARSAAGQERTFPSDTDVVEVAREGYDKLEARSHRGGPG